MLLLCFSSKLETLSHSTRALKTRYSAIAFLAASLISVISVTQAGTVTNSADSGSGSLRGVLATAANNEIIDFVPALNGATITLTSGSLNITGRTLTIDASALLSGITISGNNSSRILTIEGNADVTLRSLHFRNGREAAGNGGGVYTFQSHLVLDACSIRDCFSSANGGGLYGNGMTGSIRRCEIAGNQSDIFGGGVFLQNVNSLDLSSSQISGNKSLIGGGIYNLGASPTLANCSIQGNSGSGMQSETNFIINSNPVLRNCIVWGNTASGGTLASMQLRNGGNSKPDVAYCLIEGASDSASFNDGNLVVWGNGNLNGTLASNDPDFIGPVNPANAPVSSADLRVPSNSPVLNVGNNASGSTSLDLAGNARIQDGTIDLGAYEGGYDVSFSSLYPTLDPAADQNGNGLSNFLEYALGIDPNGPGDFSALPAVSTSGGSMFLTSTRRSNGIDIVPSWVTSTSLAPLSWQPMIENVHYLPVSTSILSPGRQQVVFQLLVTDPARFYRQGFSDGN